MVRSISENGSGDCSMVRVKLEYLHILVVLRKKCYFSMENHSRQIKRIAQSLKGKFHCKQLEIKTKKDPKLIFLIANKKKSKCLPREIYHKLKVTIKEINLSLKSIEIILMFLNSTMKDQLFWSNQSTRKNP